MRWNVQMAEMSDENSQTKILNNVSDWKLKYCKNRRCPKIRIIKVRKETIFEDRNIERLFFFRE